MLLALHNLNKHLKTIAVEPCDDNPGMLLHCAQLLLSSRPMHPWDAAGALSSRHESLHDASMIETASAVQCSQAGRSLYASTQHVKFAVPDTRAEMPLHM